VCGFSVDDASPTRVLEGFLKDHYTWPFGVGGDGVWYRVEPEVHQVWDQVSRQESSLAARFLADRVQGWRVPGVGVAHRVLTIAIRDGKPEIRGWLVERSGALPVPTQIVQESTDFSDDLAPGWPIRDLSSELIAVVGTGSIGSHACESLVEYGVHRLALVDPDRLLPGNLVRHKSGRKWLGRFKVDVVSDLLLDRFPHLELDPMPFSVVDQADMMRALFAQSAVVLCCSDGVESRLVTSHLARQSGTATVLASVLGDGEFGEVIRLRSAPSVGCLDCQRTRMRDAGEMDPEPGIDLPYGSGSRHRHMTAVGGDLELVGALAAKVSAATILEERGFADQRLAGDHAFIALRPRPGWAFPFDLTRAGEIRWLPSRPPVDGCPTCTSR
jgi:molybdopterin/thiamine biosynthesis adenylyltransferase